MEGKAPGAGQWTSTQAYVLSVICLLLGVAVGYLVRGSAPSNNALTQVRASSAESLPASSLQSLSAIASEGWPPW